MDHRRRAGAFVAGGHLHRLLYPACPAAGSNVAADGGDFHEGDLFNVSHPNTGEPEKKKRLFRSATSVSNAASPTVPVIFGFTNPRPFSPVSSSGSSSAPVRVPPVQQRAREWWCPHEGDEDPLAASAAFVPPHEIIARRGPLSCSMTEGVGRTLKGRDLRRVRNAVLRRTGFLD